MTDSTIPLAIVGCGGMGHRHLYGLGELTRAGLSPFELVGVCDPDENNAVSLAQQAEELLGKPSGSDIQQGKRTLLVIEALDRATSEDQKRLTAILDGDSSDEDVAEAVAIMERSGALAACHEQANGYLQGVRDTLAKYPQGEPRQLFEALLGYMVTRGH